jgi:hypothetical protein
MQAVVNVNRIHRWKSFKARMIDYFLRSICNLSPVSKWDESQMSQCIAKAKEKAIDDALRLMHQW